MAGWELGKTSLKREVVHDGVVCVEACFARLRFWTSGQFYCIHISIRIQPLRVFEAWIVCSRAPLVTTHVPPIPPQSLVHSAALLVYSSMHRRSAAETLARSRS